MQPYNPRAKSGFPSGSRVQGGGYDIPLDGKTLKYSGMDYRYNIL